jgi:hypothetical protein
MIEDLEGNGSNELLYKVQKAKGAKRRDVLSSPVKRAKGRSFLFGVRPPLHDSKNYIPGEEKERPAMLFLVKTTSTWYAYFLTT